MKKYKVNIKYNIDIDKSVRYDRTLKEAVTQKELFITIVTPFTGEFSIDEKIYIKNNILNILSLYVGENTIFDNTIFMELRLLNDFNTEIDEPIILYNVQKDYPIVYNDLLNNLLSNTTDIMLTEVGSTYISSINLDESIINVISEITVSQLNDSIKSTNDSMQTYQVLDNESNIVERGNIIKTYTLNVIAENGETSRIFTFNI